MKTTTEYEQAALRRSAELLDAIGRYSETSAVALHCLTAAHVLSGAGIDHGTFGGRPASDRVALDEALALFASISPNLLRDEDLLEALHHTLLAHIAAR